MNPTSPPPNWTTTLLLLAVEKCDFLEVVKIPHPKNRFLVILRSFLSTYKFFPGRRWLIPVSTFKEEYFDEKMTSLAGLEKSYPTICKNTDFDHFCLLGSTFKVDFLNVREKLQKFLWKFVREGCYKHYVDFWALYLFWSAWGGSRFESRHFPQSVILASCSFLGRPFVACYACSIVIFHSSQS